MKTIYTEKIEEKQLAQYLPLVNMTERDKEIVDRYLKEDITYTKLGEDYNISRERIRQIILKFIRKASYYHRKNEGAGL